MPSNDKFHQPVIPPDPQCAETRTAFPRLDASSDTEPHILLAATQRIGQARGEFAVPDDIDRHNVAVAALFPSKR